VTFSLAIALGANLGDPAATLGAVRPLLAAALQQWPGAAGAALRLRWSPLFETAPVGGPPGQPDYLNAVVLAAWDGPGSVAPAWPAAEALLARLQALEARFGRERRERWGPRRLDLDLLWCGAQRRCSAGLTLPHPLLGERAFVLAPLVAIDPALSLPAAAHGASRAVAAALAALPASPGEAPPLALAAAPGWPEGA
jgi:2-amino-4-hydroxy-6-hydroxymethyldihydropteridine diphosphokinase